MQCAQYSLTPAPHTLHPTSLLISTPAHDRFLLPLLLDFCFSHGLTGSVASFETVEPLRSLYVIPTSNLRGCSELVRSSQSS
jgi:hypothetical protein